MSIVLNVEGQVKQIKLPVTKALWPLFETIINSIQSLEDCDIANKKIIIEAVRIKHVQLESNALQNSKEETRRFESFIVTDNGEGFNEKNYKSFLEAYSQLKVKKGCKGIGRFLWLKAFNSVSIHSTYCENGSWYLRNFNFTLSGLYPDKNKTILNQEFCASETIVKLNGFKNPYKDSVACSLEILAKNIIEHCLPYFISGDCPIIILKDDLGEVINLNNYFNDIYKDSIHQDKILLKGKYYTLYHMTLKDGVDKHELHLCANHREVKTYQLSNYILDMNKKLVNGDDSFYYVGYLTGEYLDEAVNTERLDFDFTEITLFRDTKESEIVEAAVEHIRYYLNEVLTTISNEKKKRIDMLVKARLPKYRLLLNRRPDVYEKIPNGLSESKLDIELYKQQQQWELETMNKIHEIENKVKQDVTTDPDFQKLFDEYCENITELSKASLAEYVAKRKSVINLFERALEINDDGKYSKEARIHRIICPMQTTSDEIKYDDMNLWLIDERLAYHHFLSSDRKNNLIPVIENETENRMDLSIYDAALSYTSDPNNITSITIVELKRPQRDDSSNDPILQVLKYVRDIKNGKIKKYNGRDFGDMRNVSFYCYVIGDLTPSMRESAESRGLTETQDKQGYFGFNPIYGAYIEVISYDKLIKDALQRNKVLFDKLFEPKLDELEHINLIEKKKSNVD